MFLWVASLGSRSWERFRGIKGYISDKLTSTGPKDGSASPPNESQISHSLTSSISSLKSMASRWTSSHETGLSRPDYKEIAAVCPATLQQEQQAEEEAENTGSPEGETQPNGTSHTDLAANSSGGVSDGSGVAEREQADSSGSLTSSPKSALERLTAPMNSLLRQFQEGTQPAETTESSSVPANGTHSHPSSSSTSSHGSVFSSSHQQTAVTAGQSSSHTSVTASSRDEADGGPVTWNSARAKKSSSSIPDPPSFASKPSESELTASVESEFSSSGTFKTMPTRRLDFGKEYKESVGTPGSAHEFEASIDDVDDDVEVIQLSKKTKKGKKKRKKANVAVISSPRQIVSNTTLCALRFWRVV